jgi:hypothetical protein
MQGGFVDEAGVTHKSGHYYDISHWECLNEVCAPQSHFLSFISSAPPLAYLTRMQVESEHAMSKEFYTQV